MFITSGSILGMACGLLLFAGCATANSSGRSVVGPSVTKAASGKASEQLWVLDSGWHTGLILPRSELGAPLTGLIQDLPAARYFVFGWGNRKFYMASRPSVFAHLGALFPSQSVVLVDTCGVAPRACFTKQVKLRFLAVSTAGIGRLDRYLVRSLQRNTRGGFEPLAQGPDAGSEFFASPLSYDAFHTCNTWTAEALHVSGLPVSYHGVIFADQVWRQLK